MSLRKYVQSVPANERKLAIKSPVSVVYEAEQINDSFDIEYREKYFATAKVGLEYWVKSNASAMAREAAFKTAVTALNRTLYAKVYGLMNELGRAILDEDTDKAMSLHSDILAEMYE